MTSRPSPTPALPAGWIVFCVFCNCAGWGLSALHALNAQAYALVFLLGLAALGVWGWTRGRGAFRWPRLGRRRRRFGRLFPLGFLLLAVLALVGGVLYAPSNYDALAYRTPRVLHWLAEGRWHWIHTEFHRLNVRGCGEEWVTAPLIALTGSDRTLFLLNAVSFLLLPGRVFSLLIRLGVRPRVAWFWMWLFPTGYCFLLQAGSIGNDLFGSTLVLIALEFALRARLSQSWPEAAVSVLAAALMTAVKPFNLVLLLPWAIALVLPATTSTEQALVRGALTKVGFAWRTALAWVWQRSALRPLLGRPWALAPLAVVAAAASLLPTAALNVRYCGDWTGMKAENPANLFKGSKGLHVAVNTVYGTLSNFTPPVFPLAGAWNRFMDHTLPARLAQRMEQQFEPFEAHLHAEEMASEECAGLGLGVSLLLVAWTVQRWRHGRAVREPVPGFWLLRPEVLVPLGTLLALGVFMTQSGFTAFPRYLGPYYILLAAPLLAGASATALVPSAAAPGRRQTWFRLGAAGVFALALLPLVLSPARPLWPASRVLGWLGGQQAARPLVRRAATVYAVQGHRAEAFAPVLAALPADANPLGLTTADDPETSLWRPFGARRIRHLCAGDTPADLRRQGIRYALVSAMILEGRHRSLEQWLAEQDAELVQHFRLELRGTTGPQDWFLTRLR